MKKIVGIVVAFCAVLSGFAQINLKDTVRSEDDTIRSANSGFAEEKFRIGVQSFYQGNYNESIQEFEKALSYLPGENRILEWLGKAYYMSGIEGAALQQWNFAKDQGWGGLLLQNKIEIVGERRITDGDYGFAQRYTEAGAFPNINGNALIYSQPISVLPNKDGSIWVVAYATNEIVRFNVNGVVQERIRGPLNGLDRPTDIIRLKDGNLLVCESAGDRLALFDSKGKFIKYFGKKGRGEGELIGPQYITEDSFGNVYATDFGNQRVVVFDPDGNGLLSFGAKADSFDGFRSPTGIACVHDRIFVADSVKGAVYEFDRSGNYMGILVEEKKLKRPESMKAWGEFLIVADLNKVLTIDTATGAVYENATTGSAGSNITSAVPDCNGNIIVTDFKANEIYIMSKMTELVGGFFVQIERINADKFPTVTLEVKVENRKRQPIIGLTKSNFFITEDKHPVANMDLTGSANNNETLDVTFLIDRSYDMREFEEQVNSTVREIAASMKNRGTVRIIGLGSSPVKEFTGNPLDLSDFSVRALKTEYTDNVHVDSGLRLAVNDLINGEKKRAVIYITTGTVGQNAFTKYSLSDLTTFMNNNAVSYNTVLLDNKAPADEISYIEHNTTGYSYYVYRPEGLSSVIDDILAIPSGLYQLTYTSSLATAYGMKYLPVEIQAYLLNRSGRDETGYFSPLQ